jgi:hypothetical protein
MADRVRAILPRASVSQNFTSSTGNFSLLTLLQSPPPQASTPSLSGLIATLIPVGIVALVMTLAFLCLRRKYKRQYSPRTYVTTLRPQYVQNLKISTENQC